MSPTECARRATPPGLRSSRRTQRRRGDMSRYQQMRRPAFLEPNRCHTALLLERCPDRNLTLLDARDLIDIHDAGPKAWCAESPTANVDPQITAPAPSTA